MNIELNKMERPKIRFAICYKFSISEHRLVGFIYGSKLPAQVFGKYSYTRIALWTNPTFYFTPFYTYFQLVNKGKCEHLTMAPSNMQTLLVTTLSPNFKSVQIQISCFNPLKTRVTINNNNSRRQMNIITFP